MKTIFKGMTILSLLLFMGCGVGTYTVSSGQATIANLCVVDDASYEISVLIDDNVYQTKTVKNNVIKKRRDIKQVSTASLKINPGTHKVVILKDGSEIYNGVIFVSVGENRLIEL